MTKILKTLAITTALLGTISVSALATSIGAAEVRTTSLDLRTAPSAESTVLATSPSGGVVVVGDKYNADWYKVVYLGVTGYMPSEFLCFSENMEGNFGKGAISGSDVRLRSSASLDAPVLTTLDKGTRLSVIGVYGAWYKVQYSDGIGYVHSDYFALNGGAPEDTEAVDAGQLIVDTAMKYLDTPYVWAGTSPNGFDCSGLVYYVYKECGYSINRTAASIYENGEYVEKENLLPGDAICFSSSSNSIGHVGIYIGDGQFIHASSSSGRVIVSELSGDYYTRNYVGSRRIV